MKLLQSKKESFFNIYFVFFTLCLLYKFVDVIFDDSKKEYWGITEWMINYQGGFVRRGLRGEMVYQLNHLFNINPYLIITILTSLTFILLTFFFVKGFTRKGYPIFILPFVVFLGNPILNNYWMRADSFILLIFISIIYIFYHKPRFYLLWINILAMFGLLIHEIFIFVSIPILLLFLTRIFSRSNRSLFVSFIFSCLSLFPIFIVFLLVTYFKGTSGTAFLIWDSWKGVPFPDTALAEMNKMNMGAIAGIGLSVKGGLKIPAEFLKCFDFGLYGPLVLFITLIALYFVLSNINLLNDKILGLTPKVLNKKIISSVLIFQFVAISPLFIIGDDFSRWIYLWISSSFILLLLIPNDTIDKLLPSKLKSFTMTINNVYLSLFGCSKGLVLATIIVIGFPLYSWNFEESVSTSSMYVVLSTLSLSIKKIALLVGVL